MLFYIYTVEYCITKYLVCSWCFSVGYMAMKSKGNPYSSYKVPAGYLLVNSRHAGKEVHRVLKEKFQVNIVNIMLANSFAKYTTFQAVFDIFPAKGLI